MIDRLAVAALNPRFADRRVVACEKGVGRIALRSDRRGRTSTMTPATSPRRALMPARDVCAKPCA
jgi:sugar lactone lactonase YvrE